MQMSLSVKDQSIETSGITKDYKEALCEYIWNGFEANGSQIQVLYSENELGGIETITITDNGDGINFDLLSETFGAFLASQKNSMSLKLKTKANKGKGRFSFTAFALKAYWITTYKAEGKYFQYRIDLLNENKQVFEYSNPVEVTAEHTGTSVTFEGVHDIVKKDMQLDALEEILLKEFAWFLYLNKEKSFEISINNEKLDYVNHINPELSEDLIEVIEGVRFNISLVVWNERIKEKFCAYYFDENYVLRGSETTTFNRNTVEFNHSVFIRSNFFDGFDNISLLEQSDQISLNEQESRNKVLKSLHKFLQEFIGRKLDSYLSSKADKHIGEMMERRHSFPKFSDDIYGKMRKMDLVKVTKEIYCIEPKIFYKLRPVQEKSLLGFLDLLLSSTERENVLTIIEQIVELSQEQRHSFAEMLKKTKLENVINTIKFIEDRYRIIEVLKTIVFDLTNFANERDHIQKIIEQHYWIFGERYNLASNDQRMQKALSQYLGILYGEKAPKAVLADDTESERRMDIFLCSSRNIESSFGIAQEENIIVELKAPQVTLNKKVMRQIEDYMDYVRQQPMYNSEFRKWKFIAVCREVDEDVKSKYKTFEEKGKPGLINQVENYEVYAMTWDDIFKSFELRHSFMLDKLKYDKDSLIEQYSRIADKKEGRGAVESLSEVALNVQL